MIQDKQNEGENDLEIKTEMAEAQEFYE